MKRKKHAFRAVIEVDGHHTITCVANDSALFATIFNLLMLADIGKVGVKCGKTRTHSATTQILSEQLVVDLKRRILNFHSGSFTDHYLYGSYERLGKSYSYNPKHYSTTGISLRKRGWKLSRIKDLREDDISFDH